MGVSGVSGQGGHAPLPPSEQKNLTQLAQEYLHDPKNSQILDQIKKIANEGSWEQQRAAVTLWDQITSYHDVLNQIHLVDQRFKESNLSPSQVDELQALQEKLLIEKTDLWRQINATPSPP